MRRIYSKNIVLQIHLVILTYFAGILDTRFLASDVVKQGQLRRVAEALIKQTRRDNYGARVRL